ncbi:hypothetical protein LN893_15530, partial [Pontibacter sp. XAAS-A31]
QHSTNPLQGEPFKQKKLNEPLLLWTQTTVLPVKDKLPSAVLALASGLTIVGFAIFDYIHTAAVVA